MAGGGLAASAASGSACAFVTCPCFSCKHEGQATSVNGARTCPRRTVERGAQSRQAATWASPQEAGCFLFLRVVIADVACLLSVEIHFTLEEAGVQGQVAAVR